MTTRNGSGSARKSWKVVRHAKASDPFVQREWVYSSHTTELAARRARDRVRAVMARSSGAAVAGSWSWSVVFDPDDVVVNHR